MTFADLLRRYRTTAGLSQAELAERAGLSVAAISGLERGIRRHPRRDTVLALADALDLNAADQATLLTTSARTAGTVSTPAPERTIPRQLPLATRDFIGRESELATLRQALVGAAEATALSVLTITGMGGVGKTALAVQAAHESVAQFPDGQLYVDLRGFGPGTATAPIDALREVLSVFGVQPDELASDETQAVAKYRTLLAERRMLVILDNAADAQQVLPLLPGSARCAVIVTSRLDLPAIAGTIRVPLEVPPLAESLRLLATVAGRPLSDDPAWTQVVEHCGGLPLAIRIAGARLASRPNWPVSHLAGRLADERRRLDELEVDAGIGVRATLNLSIDHLRESDDPIDVRAAEAFALLGLAESPVISARQIAAFADWSERDAAAALERLVDVHLLASPAPERYRLHDLLRVAAAEHVHEVLTPDEQVAARVRWLERLSAVTWRVSDHAGHGDSREAWLSPDWWASAMELNLPEAMEWLDDARDLIVPTLRRGATGTAFEQQLAIRLAVGLNAYYTRRRRWLDWMFAMTAVREIAIASGDHLGAGMVLHDLGAALGELERYEEAVSPMQQALTRADITGVGGMQALCLLTLGHLLERLGRYEEAIPYAAKAREMAIQLQLPRRAAFACMALGMLHLKTGRKDLGSAAFEEGLAHLADPEHGWYRCIIHMTHGLASREIGDYEAAESALAACADLSRTYDRVLLESEAWHELGRVAIEQGRLGEAGERLGRALELAEREDDRLRQAAVEVDIGHALHAAGNAAEARRHWRTALAIRQEHGTDTGSIEGLLGMAEV
ncbi:tetratricopeptide repeat protein [Kribbella sp. NBC_01245]|uniref:ATP-binding protein n=1 Tax=Kribbella sp. NBC_01245 TaxID=2903578 RepID=UPI002E2D6BA7|nr:tetratricopeptide repeat protein [Kribbella sp. NBC_01245]